MPEKDGDEAKSTKSVVNKKQKQMMGEEGYDIARDQGRVRPSKDKKDATTLRKPPSKEMKKTQKVNKGPSALDIVKKKYKGQIMKVEELDLTKVAETFGGYIVEAEVTKGQGDEIKKKLTGTGKVTFGRGRTPQEKTGVEKLAKAAGIDTDKYKKLLKPQSKQQSAAAQAFRDMSASGEKVTDDVKQGLRNVAQGGDEEPKPYTPRGRRAKRAVYRDGLTKDQRVAQVKADIDQKELLKKAGASGDIGFTAPDRKSKVKKRTDRADAQGTPDPFSIDTSKASKEVAKDLGTKPVKGGLDFGTPGTGVKDFRFSPRDITTQQASDKVETGLKQAKKSFSQFSRDLQDYRDRDMPGGPRKTKRDRPDITGASGRNRPRVTGDVSGLSRQDPSVGMAPEDPPKPLKKVDPPKPVKKGGDIVVSPQPVEKGGALATRGGALAKRDQSALAKSAAAYSKFVKKNPVVGGVTSLAAYDLGKGILSKIMNLRPPSVRGGRAGFRSAGGYQAT